MFKFSKKSETAKPASSLTTKESTRELTDAELDNVSGGAIIVPESQYTVVSSARYFPPAPCFPPTPC